MKARMVNSLSRWLTEIRISTATLTVTKLDEIPIWTMKMKISKASLPRFKCSVMFMSIEPMSEIKYIEIRTHLRFYTFPFDDFMREADILTRKRPASRQPTKKLAEVLSTCWKILPSLS